VLGLTFKENCGDLRNSKVGDIINELQSYGVEVFVTTRRPIRRGDARVRRAPVRLGRPAARRRHRGGGGALKAGFDQKLLEGAGYKVWRL
jgi:UDP-N-acetyl-D-galactosamine dehydrogenase